LIRPLFVSLGKATRNLSPGVREARYEGRDLNLTTDFRDVFAELAKRHLGTPNLKTVFPGYDASDAKFRGVLG